jgi:hypothetical protein
MCPLIEAVTVKVNLKVAVAVRCKHKLAAVGTVSRAYIAGRVIAEVGLSCPVSIHHVKLIVAVAVGLKRELAVRL